LRQQIERRFVGIGQAAALLGASPATVRRWADDGFLPAYRTPGGQRRFDRREVELLLERMAEMAGRRQRNGSA
jgi:excisionase family DNA binding protein